jgi:hypothetical protein
MSYFYITARCYCSPSAAACPVLHSLANSTQKHHWWRIIQDYVFNPLFGHSHYLLIGQFLSYTPSFLSAKNFASDETLDRV